MSCCSVLLFTVVFVILPGVVDLVTASQINVEWNQLNVLIHMKD